MGFIIAWTIIGIGVVCLELYGVYRKGDDDTITETFRHWRDLIPQPFKQIVMFLVTGLLLWTILHFWDLV